MSLSPRALSLHEPIFLGNESKYVQECIETGWVSSAGKFVDRFEEMTAKALGVRHAVTVVNGTAALHLSLVVLGVRQGDEILMPSLTFIATANSAVYAGAVPRFIDVEENSTGLDVGRLEAFLKQYAELRSDGCYNRETGRRIFACMPVHVFGFPVQMDRLMEICRRYRIAVIEDATESLGSLYKGKSMGAWGDLGCLSFNGNKILTTGGGGMVVSNNEDLMKRVRHLSTQAKKDTFAYWHDEIGYNYRLPNINAALGCAQMEQLNGFLEKKRHIAQWYKDALKSVDFLELVWEPENSQSNFWLNTLRCKDGETASQLIGFLNKNQVACRPLWAPCHKQPMFSKESRDNLENTERAWRTCFNLPSSVSLSQEDIHYVVDLIKKSHDRSAETAISH